MKTFRSLIRDLSPFQLILLGFAAVILLGMLLLMLPFSVQGPDHATWDEALFTSASAVCVTGLVVRDTALFWSPFGQAVILILIQIGGLGIAAAFSVLMLLAGGRMTLRQRSTLQEALSAPQLGGVVRFARLIVLTTLAAEGLGALLMLPSFCRLYGPSGIWMAVFHSVSAFCNAGFDVMGAQTGAFSSMTGVPGALILSVLMLLIIAGGIGFLTWEDLFTHGLRLSRYRIQSKVSLTAAAVLIVLPAAYFFFSDFSGLPAGERVLSSLFQAVTPRTAGFNSAEIGGMTQAGRAVIIVLMLIGGSSGSTAGGMKTSTAAVLAANTAAVFRRRRDLQLFGRRVEEQTVRQASTLVLLYPLLALTGALLLCAAEGLTFETCFFETVSAIGTVGLSLGITPALGIFSRLVLILLMFFGRVGGLTVLYAVGSRSLEVSRFPEEKIAVG
ncbi:MAG: Trk family potassium uptake protein [Lachnospiraceae bacterium]|nr:Trk family potassium uptake protein [Lachnospiraceae bacterium]